ncbi:unnamed protein product [Mytilus coruscus]|uniref:Reverse transcriptase domain-containing protein n=1 Tax=Mytilus coruscus TaxID=42192 RepID=A0A6J8E7G3_MYTCO|nr:unnamed protein product [Mytilus coruscus]
MKTYVDSKRKSISGISKVNGTEFIASTDNEKAEVLPEFFSYVFTLESGNPVDSGKRYIKCDSFSRDELFNSTEVNKLLKDLNTSKSPGPDQVHPKVLSELANTIDSPLSTKFNESLKSGTVPKRWKIGQISALFKKGDKTSPSNYRPVSWTSVICKVMEKLVRRRIVQNMNSHYLLQTVWFYKVVDTWNSLPEHIVTTTKVKTFENTPDTYWKDHPMKLEYTIEHGQHTSRVTGKDDTMVEESIEMNIEEQQLLRS